MNGIQVILRVLHDGEDDLATALVAAADRHRAEHEIHHVAIDLAGWSRQHRSRLSETGKRYGVDLSEPDDSLSSGILAVVRERTVESAGRNLEPGLRLLQDLRDLYLAAAENSLYWEMLAQGAQATKDVPLLDVVSSCHPQTLRQVRWANTMIKDLSPQLLTSL